MISYSKKYAEVQPHDEWGLGSISSEDTHCYVDCECGERLEAVSNRITECNCGCLYFTNFICYRVVPRKEGEW